MDLFYIVSLAAVIVLGAAVFLFIWFLTYLAPTKRQRALVGRPVLHHYLETEYLKPSPEGQVELMPSNAGLYSPLQAFRKEEVTYFYAGRNTHGGFLNHDAKRVAKPYTRVDIRASDLLGAELSRPFRFRRLDHAISVVGGYTGPAQVVHEANPREDRKRAGYDAGELGAVS